MCSPHRAKNCAGCGRRQPISHHGAAARRGFPAHPLPHSHGRDSKPVFFIFPCPTFADRSLALLSSRPFAVHLRGETVIRTWFVLCRYIPICGATWFAAGRQRITHPRARRCWQETADPISKWTGRPSDAAYSRRPFRCPSDLGRSFLASDGGRRGGEYMVS